MRKKLTALVFIVLSMTLAVSFFIGCTDDLPEGVVFRGIVSDVADDPLAFEGKIALRGVIISISSTDSPAQFSIRDRNFRPCCPPIVLRVRYLGDAFVYAINNDVYVIGAWGEALKDIGGTAYISHIFEAAEIILN